MKKNIAIKIASLSLAGIILAGSLVSCADAGLSAYELALKNGTTTAKTEEEWLASLAGDDGADSVFVMDGIMDEDNTDEHWIENIALETALSKLGERESAIINMRFFRGKTQMEIAEEIGISQAQVSRIEKSALERMRKAIN